MTKNEIFIFLNQLIHISLIFDNPPKNLSDTGSCTSNSLYLTEDGFEVTIHLDRVIYYFNIMNIYNKEMS